MTLRPCPFCGSKTAAQDSSNGADEVVCGTCQAYTWGETPEAAIAAWQRRSATDTAIETLSRLEVAEFLVVLLLIVALAFALGWGANHG